MEMKNPLFIIICNGALSVPVLFLLTAEADLYIIFFNCGGLFGKLIASCHYRSVDQVVVHENVDSVADGIICSDDVSKA